MIGNEFARATDRQLLRNHIDATRALAGIQFSCLLGAAAMLAWTVKLIIHGEWEVIFPMLMILVILRIVEYTRRILTKTRIHVEFYRARV